jgi:hypothetical protein
VLIDSVESVRFKIIFILVLQGRPILSFIACICHKTQGTMIKARHPRIDLEELAESCICDPFLLDHCNWGAVYQKTIIAQQDPSIEIHDELFSRKRLSSGLDELAEGSTLAVYLTRKGRRVDASIR